MIKKENILQERMYIDIIFWPNTITSPIAYYSMVIAVMMVKKTTKTFIF